MNAHKNLVLRLRMSKYQKGENGLFGNAFIFCVFVFEMKNSKNVLHMFLKQNMMLLKTQTRFTLRHFTLSLFVSKAKADRKRRITQQEHNGGREDEGETISCVSSRIRLRYGPFNWLREGFFYQPNSLFFFFIFTFSLSLPHKPIKYGLFGHRKPKYQPLSLLGRREILIQLKRRAPLFLIWSVLMLRFY